MKRRPYLGFAVAFAVVAAHLLMRAWGLAVHTSALAGMPPSDSSLVIAPIYIGIFLLAITLAPVLLGASALEMVARRFDHPGRRDENRSTAPGNGSS